MPHDLDIFLICSSDSCLTERRGQEIYLHVYALSAKSAQSHCYHNTNRKNVAVAEEILFINIFPYLVKSQAFEKEGGKK